MVFIIRDKILLVVKPHFCGALARISFGAGPVPPVFGDLVKAMAVDYKNVPLSMG